MLYLCFPRLTRPACPKPVLKIIHNRPTYEMLECLQHILKGEKRQWEDKLVKLWLDVDVDWFATYKGWNGYQVAAFFGCEDVIKEMRTGAEHGSKGKQILDRLAGCRTPNGMTMLHLLCRGFAKANEENEFNKFMLLIIQHSSDSQLEYSDPAGATPLHTAALYGAEDVVSKLISRKVNIKKVYKNKSKGKHTPLEAARYALELVQSQPMSSRSRTRAENIVKKLERAEGAEKGGEEVKKDASDSDSDFDLDD
mmetsp:Transcript_1410/g.4795  ORF Transcript_1410/g.4795 Transcript_1410/m.4795 type:complete len:253 (-) Transcript_1410:380-1138(-)|eukprot:CAMPEP_0183789618 /NCGR_PEP_ID=MMETSP0803_2-20130417/534_1 /TAXON_ID=195967 /ORGANISM="Crustomastix stigmata, Strain CCMP3273" /LENGTH=252 /DNA_ID=CAMNT_0026033793 /DNA_START=127 /DNA_END=885 /DNA_ORIENTATION=+